MTLHKPMLALMLVAGWSGAWAVEPAPADSIRTAQLSQSRVSAETLPLEKQVVSLQQQVALLQAQVNALLSAVKVSETGVVLQGPSVTIQGGKIDLMSTGMLMMRVDQMEGHFARSALLRSSGYLDLLSSGPTTMRASGETSIRGARVILNNGTKPVATAGSISHPLPNGTFQVSTGSPTVLAD